MQIEPREKNFEKALQVTGTGEIAVNQAYIDFLDGQIADIESHMLQLRALVARHAKTLEHEGLRRETDLLLSWMVQSVEGLRKTRHLFVSGPGWLNALRERVNLAKDEFSRLEGEGGNPGPPGNETEDLVEVWDGIHDILTSMESALAHPMKLTDSLGEELTLLA